MTMITKTAETLQDGITNMMAAAKEDYFSWSSTGKESISSYSQQQLEEWDSKIDEAVNFFKSEIDKLEKELGELNEVA